MRFRFIWGAAKIELHLQVEPDFRGGSQFIGKVEGGIGGDAALAVNQFIEFGGGPADSLCSCWPGDAPAGARNSSRSIWPGWMGLGGRMRAPLVVIDNLDVVCGSAPAEDSGHWSLTRME